MPPRPALYFNDYAKVVSPATAGQLNKTLEDFEKATSSQVVVAVFPKMQSPSSIEDYCHRIFESWKIGQKGKNNGVALFVFVQDRKLRIEVGYGLEGALPDALGKQIIEKEIVPHFKRGNYEQGLTAGVTAVLAATRGEYKGTGRTAARGKGVPPFGIVSVVIFVLFWLFLVGFLRRAFRGATVYTGRGRSGYSGWSGGGWSGGGGSWGGGGGGGFSGGGGSSGGGGASGSW